MDTSFVIFVSMLMLAAFMVYFLPSLIAIGKRDLPAIFVLNFIAGWTFIGWVVALVWAFKQDR